MSQSSWDDCGIWMRADLNPSPDNAQQKRDDDVVLGSGERPATPTVVTHYYGVIDGDDIFMPPPPPLSSSFPTEDNDVFTMPAPPLTSCVTSSLSPEEDDAFVPPPPPPLPCTASSLQTDGDDIFMPPPSPVSCAAFSLQTEGDVEATDPSVAIVAKGTQAGLDELCGKRQLTKVQNKVDKVTERAECIVPPSEDEVDWTSKDVDILTETGLTSLSLENSSGRTEVVDLGSKKDGCEDMVATNKEQKSTWEYCDSDVEKDTPLSQTPSSVDASPTKGICCDMLQAKGEIRRKTKSTGECQVISFLSEDTDSTQPKPERDDRNAVAITTGSLHERDSTFTMTPDKTGRLNNNKTKMGTAPAGEMSDGKVNIGSRELNYDMAEEPCLRPDGDLPPLISRDSSFAELNWTVATSILQGEQLLQRLLLVQKRQDEGQVGPQDEGQVGPQGVDAEAGKRAAGDGRVERGMSGVEGTDRRHVTTEDEDPGQEGDETRWLENQDGEEAEQKRCEMRSATKSTPPTHQRVCRVEVDNSNDNQSDGRVPADFCPIKTQEIPLPQIHQFTSSETSTEKGLCQDTEGKQDPQGARVMLFEAFLQSNTEGLCRHRTRHPAGSKDHTHPSILTRTHSLEMVSLKRNLVSRSQSFRLQRHESSERESIPERQKCKRPVGAMAQDSTRLSPYPQQQDIPPRSYRSMDSLNLSASTVGDAEERDMKRELAILRENPFFKLRPALALQPDVERDIRESREREEELHKQRCTLYGEMGRHRSEEEDHPLTTSTLRVAADDRLQPKGKLSRVWPPPSNMDQLSSGQTQEAKVPKPGQHKAALWRRWEAGIINGEQGTK